MPTKKIAIIGYSTRLPQTSDRHFWEDLLARRNLVSEVAADRWAKAAHRHPDRSHPGTSVTFAAGSIGDVSGFDAGFFHISPREAAAMDPQQRLLLEMSWEALAQAGLKPSRLRGRRCGVYIGLASTDYAYRTADDMACLGSNSATGLTASIAANRLSFFYDWRGPSMVIDTACSSGMVAFHQACRSLHAGESELAVTGAISLHLHPFGFVIFSKASMLSAAGRIRPFQEGADGYVRAEGGGVFVLKPYEAARRDGDRILAVVAHSAVNADGHKSGLTMPRPEAQGALLREAYAAAGIEPKDVDYLEAHGTGTAVGDPVEIEAIGQALGAARSVERRLPIGSVKSNLAHLETASAVPGLLKAIHCLRERRVPPTIGIDRLNPRLPLAQYNLEVVTETRELPQRGTLTIGVNSFGFGGANAHVILQSPPPWRRPASTAAVPSPVNSAPFPVMLSAASATGLQRVARDMHDAIAALPAKDWLRAVYQLNFRREWLTQRALVWARDRAELLAALTQLADTGEAPASSTALRDWTDQNFSLAPGMVWVFSGNGCQWEGMGQTLLGDPIFAAAVDEIDADFAPLAGYRLRDELRGELGADRYRHTCYAQPALFAVQVGLVRMLREHGLEPVAVIGHSVGEVAAAWACGALSLSDASRVIYFRSREQELTRGLGQMTAVAAAADTVAQWVAELGLDAELQIAAHNSPRGCTLVGSADALTALEMFLAEQGVLLKRLDLDYPFHGPHMDELRTALTDALSDIQPRAGQIPFISTVSGERLAGTDLDAEYWWQNVRKPVRFMQSCRAAAASGELFVEIGAHPVLSGYMQQILDSAEHSGRIVATLRRGQDKQIEALQNAVGALWIAGVQPHWEHDFPRPLAPVDLPSYPWERERHWHEVTTESLGLLYRRAVHPLLGYPLAGQPNTWEQRLDTATQPWLADHAVGDGALLPGAGYVELMLAAGMQAIEGAAESGLRVEGLEIFNPLLLEAQTSKVTRTRLMPEGRVEIQSRPQLDENWTLHARGRISRLGSVHAETFEPEPAQPSHCFGAGQHYALTEAVGLHYGPAFRTVSSGCMENDRLWVRLQATNESPVTDCHLAPSLLDGAFQSFIDRLALDVSSERGWGFVPVRIEALDWYPGADCPVEARVQLLRRSPQSFLGEVQLLDAQGRIRATCRGVRMRRLRLTHDLARPAAFQTRLEPRPRREATSHLMSFVWRPLEDLLADNADCRRYAEEYGPLLAAYLELNADEPDTETPDAHALWQTLIQDYPETLPWSLAAGRQRLASMQASPEAEVSHDELDRGYQRALALPEKAISGYLAGALRKHLQTLPSNARLDLLEVSDTFPVLLPHLAGHEPVRLGLFHALAQLGDQGEAQQWQHFALEQTPDSLPALDLIWAHLDLREAQRRDALLRLAATALRPGGWLLIDTLEADFWWPALGLDTAGTAAEGLSVELAAQGFETITPLHPEGLQHTVLAARRVGKQPALPAEAPEWLILGTPGDDLATLETRLKARSPAVTTLALTTDQALEGAFANHRWHTDTRAVLLVLNPQAGSDAPAGDLGQACESLRQVAVWAARQTPAPRLDVCLPGALSEAPAATELVAQGLAAFARALHNEMPQLRLRILDATPTLLADAASEELFAPDGEQEIQIDTTGARWVPRVIQLKTLTPAHSETQPPVCRLGFSTPGQLRHLGWEAHAQRIPGPGEVEVEVQAAGLNFRDVMYALGLLSDEALENGFSGPSLGLEFAGTIRAVGAGVEHFTPGDAVLGFAAASFSNRLITPAATVARLPHDMSFIQGATLPTVFFTAWYSLTEMARLRQGERLLIHGGAGGVGIAAIQIAQNIGAEIHATAGTPAKRDFLRLLGVQHVYDSRRLDFADAILRDTGGEGVDVVLNSLAGEAMRRSLDLLKPFGRFIELGKRDFYADTPLGLRPMRNNLSYFGVDADQLLAARPELTQRVFQDCLQAFERQDLYPLPATVFPSHAAQEAFRHMQQSRQIGKVVLDLQGPWLPELPRAQPQEHLAPDPEGVYLISGGTAGFGLQTALWLAQRGARKLLLLSRSGSLEAPSAERFQSLGADAWAIACDVADVTALRKVLNDNACRGPIKGVIHAAAVIEDALAENLDRAHLQRVIDPKVAGAWNLHQATQDQPLDFFVVYSSVANLLGNPGQAAYLAANGWMEALVRLRRGAGLPATALRFGPIADAGFLIRHEHIRSTLEKRLGGAALPAQTALDWLESALLSSTALVTVADLNWSVLRRQLPLAGTPQYARLDANETEAHAGDNGLLDTLDNLSEDQAIAVLRDWITQEISRIARLAPDKIDPYRKLGEVGFDSLMGMELVQALEDRLERPIPTFLLSEAPTIHHLAQRVYRDFLSPQEQETDDTEEIRQLARRHGVAEEAVVTTSNDSEHRHG